MSFLNKIIKIPPAHSIYERITALIEENGAVPADFSPDPPRDDGKIKFAPGAWEGIMTHHSSGGGEHSDFTDKFRKYLCMPDDKILKKIDDDTELDVSAVHSDLVKDIFEHKELYDPNKLCSVANTLAARGTRSSTVKLGLALYALFGLDEGSPESEIIETLGMCEHFTYYANFAADNAFEKDHYQRVLFDWSKKLNGWGKIDTIEYLDADTEEIQHWLLCHGCANSVLYAYLGLICANKARLYERLKKGGFDDEEFAGATDIISGLLDEGPCPGISAVEDPVGLIMLYLDEFEKKPRDLNTITVLSEIKGYFACENEDIKADTAPILARIDGIFGSYDIKKLIEDNIKNDTWHCINLAKSCDIDISQMLIALLKQDFKQYYSKVVFYIFGQKNDIIDEFIGICEESIDESLYPDSMGSELGLGEPTDGTVPLDYTVQYLADYPLKGKKLILLSLRSPIIRQRNFAQKALAGWCEALNKPLAKIDTPIYEKVKQLSQTETDDKLKEKWINML